MFKRRSRTSDAPKFCFLPLEAHYTFRKWLRRSWCVVETGVLFGYCPCTGRGNIEGNVLPCFRRFCMDGRLPKGHLSLEESADREFIEKRESGWKIRHVDAGGKNMICSVGCIVASFPNGPERYIDLCFFRCCTVFSTEDSDAYDTLSGRHSLHLCFDSLHSGFA